LVDLHRDRHTRHTRSVPTRRSSDLKGLYNGETAGDIARRKGLRYREDILDNMGSDELIANLFRISQTEQKLKKDNIKGENESREIGRATSELQSRFDLVCRLLLEKK